MTRRDFVAIGTAAAANAAPAEFAFFTANEASLVVLIAEQIVPADDAPGATDAGVVYYIDKQLAGPLSPFASLYRDNLPSFEPLREMSFAEQTAFLKSVEKKERGEAAPRLFSMMIDHAMQGFYGPPLHGGNRGEVSWKMLGIEHEMGGHH